MNRHFFVIWLLLITTISHAQEISKNIVLKHKIKAVRITNSNDNTVIEYSYNKDGLLLQRTQVPFLIYGSLCREITEYHYKDTFRISEIQMVKLNDSLISSHKIEYDYDKFGRLEYEFYSQLHYENYESITHFKYPNNQLHPDNWVRFIYSRDSNSHKITAGTLKFKNGKTYSLREYRHESGTDFNNPSNVSLYLKCNLNYRDTLNEFCNYSNQSEFLIGDSIRHKVTIEVPQDTNTSKMYFYGITQKMKFKPKVLRSSVTRVSSGNIMSIETQDYGEFPHTQSITYRYGSNDLLESVKSIMVYTSYSMSPSTTVYSFQYVFY